ncbi:MAG: tetratricopeptide repeat protein [Planctomycetes bacterium]|nr:tetratricopeptide repeat protein [Planctomycetota bacterium]
MDLHTWLGDAESHSAFQLDLSCLIDGELDEARSARAMLHIEACELCRSFFDDLRQQVRLHRDATDPDRLFARVAMLTGGDGLVSDELEAEAESIDLVHRLATVFYQLGKAYVLAAIDPDFRTRVFEKAVPLDSSKHSGRGFVDGVVLAGKGRAGGLDWSRARHMLNGRLEKIESPLEKGRRLLDEAVAADPEHEEARLYRAFLHAHEGRTLDAADEYREIFNSAVNEANRGHAAMQLGRLYVNQRSYRRAIACYRWVTISGLADADDRFFGARFNLGKAYAMLGEVERSLHSFETLLERHPARIADVAQSFSKAPLLRSAIESIPGFSEQLFARCSQLFTSGGSQTGGQA